jgi:hypothetical protein
MPGPHSSPGLLFSVIERPRRPDCRSRMMLARITPGPEGFDVRTFRVREMPPCSGNQCSPQHGPSCSAKH